LLDGAFTEASVGNEIGVDGRRRMPGTAEAAIANVGEALGGPLGVWVETGVLTAELQALAARVTNATVMIIRAGLDQFTPRSNGRARVLVSESSSPPKVARSLPPLGEAPLPTR
jgi:hypothetical protein